MNRALEGGPSGRCYAPQCNSNEQNEVVLLLPEEMAALDLIDVQGLEQEAGSGGAWCFTEDHLAGYP